MYWYKLYDITYITYKRFADKSATTIFFLWHISNMILLKNLVMGHFFRACEILTKKKSRIIFDFVIFTCIAQNLNAIFSGKIIVANLSVKRFMRHQYESSNHKWQFLIFYSLMNFYQFSTFSYKLLTHYEDILNRILTNKDDLRLRY